MASAVNAVARRAGPGVAAAAAAALAAEPAHALRDAPADADDAGSLLGGSWLTVGDIVEEPHIDGALVSIGEELSARPGFDQELENPLTTQMLEHGAAFARDSAIREAVAQNVARRFGAHIEEDARTVVRDAHVEEALDAASTAGSDAASETDALRAVIAALRAENAQLREQQGDTTLADQLAFQRDALSDDLDDASLPPTPADSEPDSVRDYFARLHSGDVSPIVPAHARGGIDGGDPDDPDYTLEEHLLGAALAVASLVILVAATRRLHPHLAKRAATLCAAAIAGVIAKTTHDEVSASKP